MGSIRSFRDLDVWRLSMDLVMDCYRLTEHYPPDERYALRRETRRSAISIPSNIAEGHNHVNIAIGSQAELDTQVEVASRLNYFDKRALDPFADKLARVGQMLHGLQRSLRTDRTSR